MIAHISPRLKKIDLDSSDVQSYRPISNLSNSLNGSLLSSSRLISTQVDLFPSCSLHTEQIIPPRLLYWRCCPTFCLPLMMGTCLLWWCWILSAAFDMVDHGILLWRLDISYSLNGTMLHMFDSYLVGRRQQVRICSTFSLLSTVVCHKAQPFAPCCSFYTPLDCCDSLRALTFDHVCMLMIHRSMASVSHWNCRHSRTASQQVSIKFLSGCIRIASSWIIEDRSSLSCN